MSGPTEAAGLASDGPKRLDDGRWLHRVRQSWLKETDTCLEKSRLKMFGLLPDETSDAASMGTAVHAAIEVTLQMVKEFDSPLALVDAVDVAQETFSELIVDPSFRWVQMKEKGARAFIERAVAVWYRQVLPDLRPQEIELSFGPLILHEDDKRVIEVTGTIDHVDKRIGAMDWKTAGRAYEIWESERWAVQPTVYLWALHQLGIVTGDGPWPFTFVVLIKGGTVEVQRVTVERHAGDFAWLVDKCVALATLIEADLPVWPKSDNHALCSPRWCPAFAAGVCKGAHYQPEWPKPSRPRAVDASHLSSTLGL